MSKKNKKIDTQKIGRRVIISKVEKLPSVKKPSVTYIQLSGLIPVPTSLANVLTRQEIFNYFKARGIIAESTLIDLTFSKP